MRNAIEGNSIFSNGGLGIDLNGNGFPEINDTGDVDTGPNNLQNYPVLSAAMTNGTQPPSPARSAARRARRTGSSSSRAARWMSPVTVKASAIWASRASTTDGFGNATIGVTLTPLVPLAVGEYVTATATDLP